MQPQFRQTVRVNTGSQTLKADAEQQNDARRVPMLYRLAERCAWISYHNVKNDKEKQYGTGRLEWLKRYYSENTPIASMNKQDKLAARYEQKMKEAHALILNGYTRLAMTELEEGRYAHAKKAIANAKRELAAKEDNTLLPDVMKVENLILAAEVLKLAECGMEERAMEDINEMKGVDGEQKGVIASVIHNIAAKARKGGRRSQKNATNQYTPDEILDGALLK